MEYKEKKLEGEFPQYQSKRARKDVYLYKTQNMTASV